MRIAFFLFSFLLALGCQAQIQIDNPWARATAPGTTVAGGYMVIRNNGATADRLVSVSSAASAKVEMHVRIHDKGMMKMREVQGYGVPAKGTFELKPGGAHLMFTEIRRPFKEGDKIPVTLKFEKAGEVSAEFHVGRVAANAPPAHRKH